jgi:8-oxo-dGTP pyrophosphatase MutT (NUDIX family)
MDVIEVAVTVITANGSILTVWNGPWGAFTLPMTKLRRRPLGLAKNVTRIERWSDAAMRNVGECLGRTMNCEPKLLMNVDELLQSDRNGQVHHYRFQVYLVEANVGQTAPCVAAEWLTAGQIRDETRRPVSPTARELTKLLEAEAAERGLAFPPAAGNQPRRRSQAAVAIISRQDGGKKAWLVQWNRHWDRYYLVGGHREDNEAGTQCLERELREELKLEPADYQATPVADQPLQYAGWSVSTWRDTDYTVWPFRVTLTAGAMRNVEGDPANRWVTREEVLGERCGDDKPISPTTRETLEKVGEL